MQRQKGMLEAMKTLVVEYCDQEEEEKTTFAMCRQPSLAISSQNEGNKNKGNEEETCSSAIFSETLKVKRLRQGVVPTVSFDEEEDWPPISYFDHDDDDKIFQQPIQKKRRMSRFALALQKRGSFSLTGFSNGSGNGSGSNGNSNSNSNNNNKNQHPTWSFSQRSHPWEQAPYSFVRDQRQDNNSNGNHEDYDETMMEHPSSVGSFAVHAHRAWSPPSSQHHHRKQGECAVSGAAPNPSLSKRIEHNRQNEECSTTHVSTSTLTSLTSHSGGGGGYPPRHGSQQQQQQQQPYSSQSLGIVAPDISNQHQSRRPHRHREFDESQFVLHELLGQGHFGMLHRATLVEPTIMTTRRRLKNSTSNNYKMPPKKRAAGSSFALKRFAKVNLIKAKKRGGRLVELLRREISIHKRLDHDHIVQYFGHCLGPNHLSLVLEYAPLGDLFNYLSRISSSVDRLSIARQVMLQMAKAVDYLGRFQMVAHRDIKPENILVFGGGCPDGGDNDANANASADAKMIFKLCDFGWAVRFSSTTRQTTLCGTPEYVPFEMLVPAPSHHHHYYNYHHHHVRPQYGRDQSCSNHHQSNKPLYDAKYVDLWALGILMYELLHGITPFAVDGDEEEEDKNKDNVNTVQVPNRNAQAVYRRILSFQGVKYLPMDCVTVECFHLMDSLLQIDPTLRCSALDVVNHPFLRDTPMAVG